MDTIPMVVAAQTAAKKNRSVLILRRAIACLAAASALLLVALVFVRQDKKAEAEQTLVDCGRCCAEGRTTAKAASPTPDGKTAEKAEVRP